MKSISGDSKPWPELYKVSVQIPIRCSRVWKDSAVDEAFSIHIASPPINFGDEYQLQKLTAKFVENSDSGLTDIFVEWHFIHLFSSGYCNEISRETLLEASRALKILHIPGPNGPLDLLTRSIPVIESVFELIANAMQRISVCARCPELLKAFYSARGARSARGSVEVIGETFAVEPATSPRFQ